MNRTKIEWVKNPDGGQGFTWNPITGCLNGCEYCYARKLANTRLWGRYINNHNLAPSAKGLCETAADGVVRIDGDYLNPFYPRFWEDRVAKMGLYTGVGKGIFTCDMSDLFGIGIPERWTTVILEAIAINRRNRFYLLTKQPQNLIKFSPFPDNCWVGVSATDRDMWANANLYLAKVEAKVKYLSFEPLLGDIVGQVNTSFVTYALKQTVGIKWVIIGAQTKPYKPPKMTWVEEIARACDKAGIPVFLKDNLKPLLINDKGFAQVSVGTLLEREIEKGGYKLRQEMPK